MTVGMWVSVATIVVGLVSIGLSVVVLRRTR